MCVLVVDDSATIRKVSATALQRAGYSVYTCADGIEAMRWMTQTGTVPTLLFLDVVMPKMDGFEVARRIHTRFPSLPIVFISRRNGMMDRLKARLAGGKAFLVKPVLTEDYLKVVKQYVKDAGHEHPPSLPDLHG
ncbi:MAG TPA: response regulator [Ktedonosporobacter sp.]|nr:response regulator [Ktedonosporobacter sp.]